MPVIFKTATSQRVIMLDKDANMMLKTFHTSGNIPGALYAEAIPDALEALQNRIELESHDEDVAQTEKDKQVGLQTKAFPLIELMQSAIEKKETLMWDKG